MERIDSSQIHLWLAYPGEITDLRLLAEYRALLSEDELAKQVRFHFARDRHRYLVTRALVRTVLSKYAPIAPEQWRFVTNDHGRPEVANESADARGLTFNVSHSEDLIALGVTHAATIGVDVENVRVQRAAIEVADRFFAPAEVAALRALPPARQPHRFFEYWTLKEAYIKARGLGLSIALDRFAFHLDDAAGMTLRFAPAFGDCTERWTFWQLEPSRLHLVAVCAPSSGGGAHLTLHRSVPLERAAAAEFLLLRSSGPRPR